MKKTLLSIFAAALLFCSCSTSQSTLNDLRDLSQQINVEGSTYGVSDWTRTAKKFYKTDKKIAKYAADDKYSPEELQEIGELHSSCINGFKNGVTQNVGNKITTAGNILKGLLDGLTK